MRRANKQSNKPKFIITLVVLIIVIAAGAIFAKSYYHNAIYKASSDSSSESITVTEGQSILNISSELQSKGLIKSELALKIYLKINKIVPNIKPGEYLIAKNLTIPQLIAVLEEGKYKPSTIITLREGLRDEQIATQLTSTLPEESKYNENEFLNIVKNPDNALFSTKIQDFLNVYKPSGEPLTGFLYPDTYSIDIDQDSQQIVEIFLNNFITKVNSAIDLTNLNLQQENITNLYEGMILGSIIEKEASGTDDRKLISGVFHNRLSYGMALQSDATVNYITGKDDPGVLYEDLQIDSPYNTYLYAGLIPTPIDNPRIESIVAALYPTDTTYFFFFHTDSGETIYSETFDQHNQKVLQYRGEL